MAPTMIVDAINMFPPMGPRQAVHVFPGLVASRVPRPRMNG